MARAREAFGLELPLRRLFETPTIAALALTIETLRWAEQGLSASRSSTEDDREEITV
jgi:hypothetical protein